MKTYGRKTSHRQLQSILLNLMALSATSRQNLRNFLALSGLRGCPPASSFVLTPSFLRLPAWADKCFYCASADLPAAFAAASASAVWRARVRTVASFVSHLSCFTGLPAAFFCFMAYLRCLFLASPFAAGCVFPFETRGAAAAAFAFLLLVGAAGSAPVFKFGGASSDCGVVLSASLSAFLGSTGAS